MRGFIVGLMLVCFASQVWASDYYLVREENGDAKLLTLQQLEERKTELQIRIHNQQIMNAQAIKNLEDKLSDVDTTIYSTNSDNTELPTTGNTGINWSDVNI